IGDGAGAVVEQLPSLKPGELLLLSPDHFGSPCPLAVRRLHSEHKTLDEEGIDAIAEPWRRRFAPLERDQTAAAPPMELDATVPAWAGPATPTPKPMKVEKVEKVEKA